MKGKAYFWFVTCITVCLAALAVFLIPRQIEATDSVAVNRIKQQAEASWPNLAAEDFNTDLYPFSIVNTDGQLVFRTSPEAAPSVFEAISRNDIILDFLPAGTAQGSLLIHTGIMDKLQDQKLLMVRIFAGMVVLIIVSAGIYQRWLYRRIVAPFQKLQGFAHRIAAGNLDVGLEMDKDNIFGAFTESFDLMRDQLKESKKAEVLANQSKKELVASLSHDIKTPITSIKLISELLQVTAPEEYKEKLETIYGKAEQIDRLVTNLFQSALEELGQLKVNLTDTDSAILNRIFQDADYYRKLDCPSAPGCLIRTDPLRLEQVIDNIINNSYKYANSNITIRYEMSADFLTVRIRDYGPGVTSEELPHLTDKFYRGQKAVDSHMEGSGLGLFIAGNLMERMEGDISITNEEVGLCVTLLLPFA